jgi:hypothetical protein
VRAVFAGLPNTDWATLERAYRSAEDVPAMLRGLASEDEAAYRHLSYFGVTDSSEVRLDERLPAACAQALGGG